MRAGASPTVEENSLGSLGVTDTSRSKIDPGSRLASLTNDASWQTDAVDTRTVREPSGQDIKLKFASVRRIEMTSGIDEWPLDQQKLAASSRARSLRFIARCSLPTTIIRLLSSTPTTPSVMCGSTHNCEFQSSYRPGNELAFTRRASTVSAAEAPKR